MDDRLRNLAREQFGLRCAYCGVHENDAGATLTLDHHRPRVRGGTDESDNLVYACARCNDHKGSYWHEHDPPHVRLLHPKHDDLEAHLQEDEEGRILGTTPEGEFFSHRLHLNRPQLIAYRRELRERRTLRAKLAAAHDTLQALERRMEELSAAIDAVADEIDHN